MLNAKKFYPVQSLSSLRRKVLEYLLSDRDEDYYINPYEAFSDLYYHRYSTLTNFIEDIKVENPLTISIYCPQAKPGMRLLNKECPEERGKLVKFNYTRDKRFSTACLDMDTAPKSGLWKFLDKLMERMWIISWMFPNIGKILRNIPYSSLQLEKEHFKRVFVESQLMRAKKVQLQQQKTNSDIRNKLIARNVHHALEVDSVLENLIGSPKGIAGYNNSCYLDSLLVSMFYCSTAFDALLKSTPGEGQYTMLTRKILHNHIVKPLRREYYCSSESAMKLRKHLRSLDADVMGSFMDVEQLLYLLVESAMDEPAFIRYNTGATDFMHLMVIDPDDIRAAITVQTNFEMSMKLTDNLKLKSVPNPGLILGLPRSNGKLVKVKAVIPQTELKIQELMVPANCMLCERAAATWDITDKYNRNIIIPTCDHCSKDFVRDNKDENLTVLSRTQMKLSAIICIRGAHYTTFVRNTFSKHEWLFFDSMAGNNPNVILVMYLGQWLDHFARFPQECFGFQFEEMTYLIQRAFTDGHMCIYEPVYLTK